MIKGGHDIRSRGDRNPSLSCTSSQSDNSPGTQRNRDRTGKANAGDNEKCETIIRLLFNTGGGNDNIQHK